MPSAYLVNTAADSGGGTGTTGTLRYCINQADQNPGSTIQFASSLSGSTITLTQGQLVVSDNMTITGLGSSSLTVSGNKQSRIFEIDAGATATITGLTISGGAVYQSDPGGGIYNNGTLAVNDCILSGCSAGLVGGGIDNAGSMTVNDCTLSGNSASTFGGGVFNSGSMTIDNCTLSGSFATFDGGIENIGNLAVNGSILSGNLAGDGGGIFNNAGDVAFSNSTLSGNSASTFGGGIYNNGATVVGNGTLYGNSAREKGGGIYNTAQVTYDSNGNKSSEGGNTLVSSSTLSGNTAASGGGIFSSGVGSSVLLSNTLVAANSGDDVSGALNSGSAFNLIGDGAGMTGISNDSNSNQVGSSASPIVPLLAPLGYYGGPTETVALVPGSPAIGHGNPLVPFRIDQRGFTRAGLSVDIGAFQTQASPLVVNSASNTASGAAPVGDLSLRDAIDLANALSPVGGANSITFDLSLAGSTITLAGVELPQIAANMTISGLGSSSLTLSGNNQSRIFQVDSGVTAAISNLTISGGSVSGSGGGVCNSGSLSLEDCNLSGNTASFGGGVSNRGSLALSDCALSGNSAVIGGGIDNLYGSALTVSGSTVSDNVASESGGGVFNSFGTLRVSDSTLSGNSAVGGAGGGICNIGGSVTVSTSTLAGNTADRGGGIFNSGTMTIRNGTVAGNSGSGGGILAYAGSLLLHNTLVAGNNNGSTPSDVAGTLSSASDYNLIGDGSGGLSVSNHNLLGSTTTPINPLLAPLGNYSGPTQTMALLPGSPAIDAGDSNAPGLPSTDQRGYARIVGNAVDIGADEYRYDLAIGGSAPASVQAGQTITYNLTVTNSGPDTAGPVTLTDVLPGGVPYPTLQNRWTFTPNPDGTITAATSIPTLAAGASANFPLTVLVIGLPSTFDNPLFVGPTTWDTDPANNSGVFNTSVQQAPSTTSLSSSSQPSVSNQNVTFTATVSSSNGITPSGVVTFSDASGVLGTDALTVVNGVDQATFTTSTLAVGSNTIAATYGGDINFTGSNSEGSQQVNAVTTSNLQAMLGYTPQPSFQENDNSDAQSLLNAIDGLGPQTAPVTLTLDLGSGSYSDLAVNPPAGVTLILNGVSGSTTIVGQSPALTVGSGTVVVENMTLTTSTDAPTVLVEGGSLTLSGDDIEESTGYSQAALTVTGGSLTLGSTNTLNVNGTGQFLEAGSFDGITEQGDNLEHNGSTIAHLLSLISVSGPASTPAYGQSIPLTVAVAAVDGGAPTGSVDFFDATTNQDLGGTPIVDTDGSYQAVLNTSALTAGTHNIIAIYSGDSTYGFSSGSAVINVAQATPTPIVSDSGGTYNGQAFAATAAVAGVSGPAGSALENVGLVYDYQQLNSNGNVIADLGAAAPVNAGSFRVTVSFAGSTNYTAASKTIAFTISPAPISYTIGNDTQAYGWPANLAADLTSSFSTGINGETLNITYSSSGNTNTAAAGAYAITGVFSNGTGLASNYTIAPTNGTLTVLGSGVIVVGNELWIVGGTESNDHVEVDPTGPSSTGSTGVKVSASLNHANISTTYNRPFSALYVFTYGGNDRIDLAPSLTINATVGAGNGNDHVQLGGGNNTVTLGNGNDQVTLGDGANTLTLGNGNDNVRVGNGNNVIVEGNGNDSVNVGDGDNLVVAGLGQHNVTAGNGSNILIDGSVQLTQSGDSLRQVLDDWIECGAQVANIASIRSRLQVTYNTQHANKLDAGSGLDWFWATDTKDSQNAKATDLRN